MFISKNNSQAIWGIKSVNLNLKAVKRLKLINLINHMKNVGKKGITQMNVIDRNRKDMFLTHENLIG